MKQTWDLSHRIRKATAVIVSYPKTGRTWIKYFLKYYLAYRLASRTGTKIEVLEKLDIWDLSLMSRTVSPDRFFPLLFFTHDFSDFYLKWTADYYEKKRADKSEYKNLKVILLIRNAYDTLVSGYYHILKRTPIFEIPVGFAGNLSAFIREPHYGLPKILAFYKTWYNARSVLENFNVVSYEQLRRNPRSEFHKVVKYLEFPVDLRALNYAVEKSSFQTMLVKQQSVADTMGDLTVPTQQDVNSYKVRKGKIGGYREELGWEDVRWISEQLSEYKGKLFPELLYQP